MRNYRITVKIINHEIDDVLYIFSFDGKKF